MAGPPLQPAMLTANASDLNPLDYNDPNFFAGDSALSDLTRDLFVGGLEHVFFPYWGSSSQLTFICFRGIGFNHQPDLFVVSFGNGHKGGQLK